MTEGDSRPWCHGNQGTGGGSVSAVSAEPLLSAQAPRVGPTVTPSVAHPGGLGSPCWQLAGIGPRASGRGQCLSLNYYSRYSEYALVFLAQNAPLKTTTHELSDAFFTRKSDGLASDMQSN